MSFRTGLVGVKRKRLVGPLSSGSSFFFLPIPEQLVLDKCENESESKSDSESEKDEPDDPCHPARPFSFYPSLRNIFDIFKVYLYMYVKITPQHQNNHC